MHKELIKGKVGALTKSSLSGWALYLNSEDVVELELWINDKKVQETSSNIFKSHLLEKGMHPTGNCGFKFDYDFSNIKLGIIEIKAKKSSGQLFSPIRIINEYLDTSVLILGLAKSGTSILTYKISESYEEPRVYFEPRGHKGIRDLDFHSGILAKKGAKNIITKLIFTPANGSINDIRSLSLLYRKKVWIIRDPRDLIISSFLYRWNKSHGMSQSDFNRALARVEEKENDGNSISISDITEGFINIPAFIRNVYGEVDRILKILPKDWFVIKYEDLVDGKYHDLEEYLSISINKEAEVPKRIKRVVRSKKYGNWRKWFLEEDVKELSTTISPILDSLGYDATDWELEKETKLNPNEGSLYMKRIFSGE